MAAAHAVKGVLVISALVAAVACAPVRRAPAIALVRPSTDAVLRLIGRWGGAHACPVSDTLALTAAHVTDARPFDLSFPALPLVWSDGLGHEGELLPRYVYRVRDLALMESSTAFVRWYPIADEMPRPGDRLIALGYDWRKRRDAYAPRPLDLTVLRIVARNIIADERIPRGSSGSCVLNARGQVVAVLTWGQPTEDQDEASVAVGVWGETFEVRPVPQ